MRPTRPVLRYHGGKWRLAPHIIPHFPEHRIYVEPFGGAASVLMRKPRSFAEVYNDLDGDVVNVFRVLRNASLAERLAWQLEMTPWSRAEFADSYEPTEDAVERARRTIVRCFMGHGTTSRRKNKTGFRGKAYRQNQTGAMDWVGWPEQIPAYVERLRGVTIECRPAVEVIAQQDEPDTLFYVDPPYVQETRTSITCPSRTDRAYAHDMETGDHAALAEVLRNVKGMVVVSGYHHESYEALYAGWRRVELRAWADGGHARTEVLWINRAATRMDLFA